MQPSPLIDQKLFTLGCQQFYFTVASRAQFLQQGYQLVYKYLSLSQHNREQTLLHLLSDKAPVLTLVTRTYPVVYSDGAVGITQEERVRTKEYLILQILLKKIVWNFNKQPYATKKNLNNLLLFLIHFHNNQGFEGWVVFYQKLLQQLIKINSDLIGVILVEILKNSDDRVSCFSKYILLLIINNQSTIKISQQDSLQIIYYCVKSMAYMNGTQDDVLQQYFEPFEQKILQYILGSISKSFKIMKFSLKILTVFVADYQIQLQKDMIVKLKECSKQLAIEHLGSRLKESSSEDLQNQDQEQQTIQSLSIIIYQLIELFETLLNAEQIKISEYEVFLTLCLPALLLNKNDYTSYNSVTESYLADIEDQGHKCLRNKVVSFFLELYQGDYPTKSKTKMHNQIVKYTTILQYKNVSQQKFAQQLIQFFNHLSLPIQLDKQHLPLFEQSLTFLLYHLTEQILTFDPKNLQQNKQTLMMNFGKNLEVSNVLSQNRIIKVAYINLLNKLVKSMDKGVKESFYGFLVDNIKKVSSWEKEKGFLLSVCRGIAYVSSEVQIIIAQQQSDKGISLIMLENLVNYLTDTQTLQQSAHLILQFFLTLLKKVPNAYHSLKQIISSQVQIHILSTFIHDGTIADVVIDLLAEIASQELVTYLYTEFVKGFAKEQNLALLIARWVKIDKVVLIENDIKQLLSVYSNQFVSKIIKEFLSKCQSKKLAQNLSPQIIGILNDKIHPSWILPLIGCNILRNPQTLLLNTVQNITYELTSQYEIQNQLLLPFYTFINDPIIGVNIIKSRSTQLYEDFMNKLMRYATLFQGPNLKVITSHVLLNICQVDPAQIKPVFELISTFGTKAMENDEWEDEEGKDQEDMFDRMFNMKMVNDEVEKDFAQIFPNILYDVGLVNSKVDKLSQIMK